jgi:hypothetical protein
MDEDEQVNCHLQTLIFLGSIEQDIMSECNKSKGGVEHERRRLLLLRGRIQWEVRSIEQMRRKRRLGS